MSALLYYDYALTFDEEVALIWGMKFSSSTLLYIFCRYAMVANLLYLLADMENLGMRASTPIESAFLALNFISQSAYLDLDESSAEIDCSSCDVWYKVIALLGVLGRAAVIGTPVCFETEALKQRLGPMINNATNATVTFTLRTYVVWAQSRLILASLVVIGVATVVTDAAFRSSGIFSVRRNFTYFLMQEGAIYFWSVFTYVPQSSDGAQLVQILQPGLAFHDCDSKYLHDLLNAFTLPLSGVLTARFLLHLRSWNKSRSDAVSCTTAVDVDEEIASYDTSSQWSENITHLVSTGSVYSDTTSGWVSTAGFGEDPVVIVKRMLPQ
ncbi:hypothetical protein D9757_007527 [Collybiopsis confluens]|uniref:DUF6533 domain-containing protein n=1 Tax=Collybiopsis confluens TaxID=2823264 RepID=A0A8H5HJU1_9AGAR|nr:hypothetical protein D9757_007527 [Collybiopsis confluens]